MRRTVAKSVMQSLATIATMALTTACSVGSFTGKVGGIGFTPKDAIYAYAQYTSSNPDAPAKLGIAIVTLTSTAGACDDLANHVDHQRSESVYFTLFSTQGTADALPKGDYPLSFSADTDPNTIQNVAYAYFNPTDPNCDTLPSFWDAAHSTYSDAAIANAGTLKVTDPGKNSLAADFNLTFGTGDKASGSLNATSCQSLKDSLDYLAAIEGFDADSSAETASQTVTRTCKP